MTDQCHSGHSTQVVPKQDLLSVKVLNRLEEVAIHIEQSVLANAKQQLWETVG